MTKTYKVVGETVFLGHAPGATFEADFTDGEEQRYTERGSIEIAGGDAAVQAESPVVDPNPAGDGQTSEDEAKAKEQADAEAKAKAEADEKARLEAEDQARGRGRHGRGKE